MIDLTILSPVFYKSLSRVPYFAASVAKWELVDSMHVYGEGEPFRGWIHSHVDCLLDELRKVTTSHVMFTDSNDVIFNAGVDVISNCYELLSSPPLLFGVEETGLNAGSWMGATETAIEALKVVQTEHHDGDPQVRWRELFAQGKVDLSLDTRRSVFYVGHGEGVKWVGPDPMWHDEVPCVIHLAGGYTDPEHGRNAELGEWWDKLNK